MFPEGEDTKASGIGFWHSAERFHLPPLKEIDFQQTALVTSSYGSDIFSKIPESYQTS